MREGGRELVGSNTQKVRDVKNAAGVGAVYQENILVQCSCLAQSWGVPSSCSCSELVEAGGSGAPVSPSDGGYKQLCHSSPVCG